MSVQLTYVMIQDWQTVKRKGFLLYQGVYDLQILHTASLVGQDLKKIIAMGVQLAYILIQDRKSLKK